MVYASGLLKGEIGVARHWHFVSTNSTVALNCRILSWLCNNDSKPAHQVETQGIIRSLCTYSGSDRVEDIHADLYQGFTNLLCLSWLYSKLPEPDDHKIASPCADVRYRCISWRNETFQTRVGFQRGSVFYSSRWSRIRQGMSMELLAVSNLPPVSGLLCRCCDGMEVIIPEAATPDIKGGSLPPS